MAVNFFQKLNCHCSFFCLKICCSIFFFSFSLLCNTFLVCPPHLVQIWCCQYHCIPVTWRKKGVRTRTEPLLGPMDGGKGRSSAAVLGFASWAATAHVPADHAMGAELCLLQHCCILLVIKGRCCKCAEEVCLWEDIHGRQHEELCAKGCTLVVLAGGTVAEK